MLKRFWNWLLGKTTIDEKIVEKVEQVQERVERVKEEVKDVVAAVKEVAKQASDVTEAAAGKPRRGRKPAAKKNALAETATVVKPAAKRTATKGRKAGK